MKYIINLFVVMMFISFISCKEGKRISTKQLSDNEFIEFISDSSYLESIIRIDSLTKVSNYSIHQTGLLYYEKGRNLGHLEKDIEAIGSLKKALVLFKKENNKRFIAKTSMLLADSNAFLSRKEKALEHITLSLKIFKEIRDKKGETKALNSLSHIEFQYNNFDKALEYIKQASVIQLEINDMNDLAASYNNIGYVLEQTKDYENAINYYQKAIKLNKEINRQISSPLRNLGYVYLINNEPEKCKVLYLEALKIEEQADRLSIQKEIYDVLLEVSIKDRSFENSSLYIEKRDSVGTLLTTLENKEKIKLVENQYILIASEKELQQEKKSNTKNKIIFTVLIGLLLFLGLFLVQRYRNSKLKLTQEKLVLEQKVLLTQMNPHFIFNALTAIQKTIFDNNPLVTSTYLSRFSKLIRQNFELINKKEITLEEDLEALKNYIETQQLRFEDKFDYIIEVDERINTTFTKIPPMLLQPFVENSIEHGIRPKKGKGSLQVHIHKEKEYKYIEIIDNGVGYRKKKNSDNREHAIEIFLKRLKLRNFGEEKLFSIQSVENNRGTRVTIKLYI